MQETVKLKDDEVYLIINKNASVVIFEPVTDTKVDSKIIIPTAISNKNLLASNIAIALLQKIKTEKSFINELLNWFHNMYISVESETVH